MKFSYIFLPAVLMIVGISCKKKKDVHCTNAQLCVYNQSHDTIQYSWGSSQYTGKIAPGGHVCKDCGAVNITYSKLTGKVVDEQTSTEYFDSSKGDYAIPVDECNEERIIQ